jgi:hypothetical protein
MVVVSASLVPSIALIGGSAIPLPIDSIVLTVILIIRAIAIIPLITSFVTIYGPTRQSSKAFIGKGPRPQT